MKLNDTQMELSLNSRQQCPSHYRRQRRQTRAQWWFARMRQLVESATDWQPAPTPRPVQTSFVPLLVKGGRN